MYNNGMARISKSNNIKETISLDGNGVSHLMILADLVPSGLFYKKETPSFLARHCSLLYYTILYYTVKPSY